MKIIHITEALGGGVVHSLSQLARAQAADGHKVIVAYSLRLDTPLDQLSILFPEAIERRELSMVTAIHLFADLKSLIQIYLLLNSEDPDIIHLHSSKAGVLGRVAAFLQGKKNKVFYSPRGFSFLREDVSQVKQKIFLGLERFASLLGGTVIGCSATETDLARVVVGHVRTSLVENSIDLNAVQICKGNSSNRVTIMTSGRICYQKAPWRFREVVLGCADLPADFGWLGDGDLSVDLTVNGVLPQTMRISGWLPRAEVYSELAKADIFVLASLWEGMPLALIEAQAAGLPAVVSDVAGNRDVVIDGETGFICKSDAELLEKIRLLIVDPSLRIRLGKAARKTAVNRFSTNRMHYEMMSVYESCRKKDIANAG